MFLAASQDKSGKRIENVGNNNGRLLTDPNNSRANPAQKQPARE
jgi:hypothetical protein